jgi:hypothetical protein
VSVVLLEVTSIHIVSVFCYDVTVQSVVHTLCSSEHWCVGGSDQNEVFQEIPINLIVELMNASVLRCRLCRTPIHFSRWSFSFLIYMSYIGRGPIFD